MMIYFYKNKFLPFNFFYVTYYLLEATLNVIREFFFFFLTVNLFSLINGEAV